MQNEMQQNEHAKNVILDRIIDSAGPETTGKFGTGFLTTHLLSRIVIISGVFISSSQNPQDNLTENDRTIY